MRITVERPLRLRYQVTDDTLAALVAYLGGFGETIGETLLAEDCVVSRAPHP